MKKIYLTWEYFNDLLDILVTKIKNSDEEFNSIYAIPRGGLVIGVCLSHKLNIPLVDERLINDNTLIVDDISDMGTTLVKYYCDGLAIATLFSTDWTISKPDWFVVKKLNRKEWIVFPWENNMTERQTTLNEFKKEEKKEDDTNTEK